MNPSTTKLIALSLFFWVSVAQAQKSVTELALTDIKRGNIARLQSTLEGVDVNYKDQNNTPILMWVALKTNLDMVKKFVAAGADPKVKGVIYLDEEKTGFYGSLMSIAVGENNFPLLKYLADDLKINVNEKEYEPNDAREVGWAPSQWASQMRNKEMLDYLVSKGAKLDESVFIHGGLAYLNRRQFQKAIDWTNSLMETYKPALGDSTLACVHYVLGQSYDGLGDYKKAESELLQAAKNLEAYKGAPHRLHFMILHELGLAYGSLKNYDKELEVFFKLLNNREVLDDNKQMGVFRNGTREIELCNSMAYVFQRLDKFNDAEFYFQRGLRLARKIEPANRTLVANMLIRIGNLKYEQDSYNEAIEFYNQSVAESEQTDALLGIAKSYSKLKRIDEGEEYMAKAVQKTIAKYGEGSKEHLKILSADIPLFYITSESSDKMATHISAYFQYKLKEFAALKKPLSEQQKKDIRFEYKDKIDVFFFMATQLFVTDTTLSSRAYNYHRKVFQLLNDGNEVENGLKATTWQEKKNALPKKEAFIELIESQTYNEPTSRGIFPDFYAVIISKDRPSLAWLPLYDSSSKVNGHLFETYERLTRHARQNLSTHTDSWKALEKDLEGVKKINLAFAEKINPVFADPKKADIKNLLNLNTKKYFLEGVKAKVVDLAESK